MVVATDHYDLILLAQQMWYLQDAPWLPDKPVLQVWAEFAYVAIIAHQRRGESDAVAFWMYQLMALDTMAEEWQQVMQQSNVQL